MQRKIQNPVPPEKRMASHRQRMRAAGLRPVQIWVPDTRSPHIVEICRRQARAVAASDPAGDEPMRFVAEARDRPEF
jgi:hypothetical protein